MARAPRRLVLRNAPRSALSTSAKPGANGGEQGSDSGTSAEGTRTPLSILLLALQMTTRRSGVVAPSAIALSGDELGRHTRELKART
jgi:hypothetical protein